MKSSTSKGLLGGLAIALIMMAVCGALVFGTIPSAKATLGTDFSGVRAYRTSALSLTSWMPVDVGFNNEAWDEGNYHDAATNNNRFVVPETGYYQVHGHLVFASPASSMWMLMRIRLNNSSTYLSRDFTYTYNAANEITADTLANVALTAGDYVTIEAYSNANVTVNVQDGNATFAEVTRLR